MFVCGCLCVRGCVCVCSVHVAQREKCVCNVYKCGRVSVIVALRLTSSYGKQPVIPEL